MSKAKADEWEHRFITSTSCDEIRERLNRLLQIDPAEWSQDDQQEWRALKQKIDRKIEDNRVFSIGDNATLVGYEMTDTNGLVSYRDEYNQNEYSVVVTGYNVNLNKWEVMIPEDVLENLVSDRYFSDDSWRETYITDRPANGGISGYVLTCTYQGNLPEKNNTHRREGLYTESDK